MNEHERENERLLYYCLITNVHGDGRDFILVASARLHARTHTHHSEPCVMHIVYAKLGWGTLPVTDATLLLLHLYKFRHMHNAPSSSSSTASFFLRTISLSWSNWSHFEHLLKRYCHRRRNLCAHMLLQYIKCLFWLGLTCAIVLRSLETYTAYSLTFPIN